MTWAQVRTEIVSMSCDTATDMQIVRVAREMGYTLYEAVRIARAK